jgi:hypothetical protein
MSKIQVQKNYSDYYLVYAKGDIVLKEFINLYRTSLIKNHGVYNANFSVIDIDEHFEKILNECVSSYFERYKLPFIYHGKKEKSQEEYIEIMNQIGHILSRLDKQEFTKIYDIVNNDVDVEHYTMEPFRGTYDLSIMEPLDYVGIMIQRLLHELIIDNKNNELEYERVVKQYQKDFEDIIAIFNYYQDYVDSDVLKANVGKLVKTKKIIF